MDASFLIILALAAGAMFLMTSRTRKQQREAQNFRANLAPGQEVMTGSGMFGTIVEVDEERDVVTIESTPGNQSRWLRAAVAKLIEPPVEAEETEGLAADEDVDAGTGSARAGDTVGGRNATYGSAASITPGTSTTGGAEDVVVPDDLSGLNADERDRPEQDRDRRDEGTTDGK